VAPGTPPRRPRSNERVVTPQIRPLVFTLLPNNRPPTTPPHQQALCTDISRKRRTHSTGSFAVSMANSVRSLRRAGVRGPDRQSASHSDSTPYPDLLSPENLLGVVHSMRTRQAQGLQYSPCSTSGINALRLAGNLFSFLYPPQETNTRSSRLGLLEFLVILENAYDCKFFEELTSVTLLETLWGCTMNIAMWSQVIRWKKISPRC
jgi:hypothetical protein